MKNLILCCVLLVMFIFSGCVMRTYSVEKDRVDQEIYGNRGIIVGTPPAVEEVPQAKKTRTIYNLEVEVPSTYRPKSEVRVKTDDKELYGNRGYVKGRLSPEKEVYISTTGKSSAKKPQAVRDEFSSPIGSCGAAKKECYVVQKGDTLQKISKKFFGTTKKWTAIYEANKNILKSPNKIRPGQKLVIPK